jgi:hypothetical protein
VSVCVCVSCLRTARDSSCSARSSCLRPVSFPDKDRITALASACSVCFTCSGARWGWGYGRNHIRAAHREAAAPTASAWSGPAWGVACDPHSVDRRWNAWERQERPIVALVGMFEYLGSGLSGLLDPKVNNRCRRLHASTRSGSLPFCARSMDLTQGVAKAQTRVDLSRLPC